MLAKRLIFVYNKSFKRRILVSISDKRVHLVFRGVVQGVGFRFTSESIAASLGIKGWVRNVPGGEVELIVEQREDILKDFISRLENEFGGYIREKEADWSQATGEFPDFRIKF